MKVLYCSLLIAVVLLPGNAGATDTEEMWVFGLGTNYVNLGAEERTSSSGAEDVFVDESGLGGTLTAGYGYGPNLATRIHISVSDHDTSADLVAFWYTAAVLEQLYIFRDLETFRPYVMAGPGWFQLKSRENSLEFSTTGFGVAAGGGFYYFFSDYFTLDANLRGDFIEWDKISAKLFDGSGNSVELSSPVNDSGTAFKISAGASWWF